MTTAVSPAVQKIIDEAVAAAVAKSAGEKDAVIAKLNDEITVSKMTDKQRQYFGSMTDDDEKKRFKSMSSDDRYAYMDKMKKRADDDPIVKGLKAENDELRKRLDALEGDKQLDIAKRDAREMGLAQPDAGEVLMKARRGDKDAMAEFEKRMVALAKSAKAFEKTSKAFVEIGSNSRTADGQSGSVMDEINALAAELRKQDPKLTEAQAFTKVYETHPELRERENAERMVKIHNRAA